MNKLFTLCILIGSLFSLPCYAAEPDFFINFSSCKTAVGYLVLSEKSLKITEGDPLVMSCSRHAMDISCSFEFHNRQMGIKGNSEMYKVFLDSPPLLYFATSNGSGNIAIDMSQHAAVLVNLIFDVKFVGSKVCHGLYTTRFEMENLKK